MHPSLTRTSGFTLIELIVGMLIFTIGMTGILAILHTTVRNSISSRQEIIVSNLLREQVELIKNIRNTNTRNFIPFDRVRNNTTPSTFTGGNYVIENNFTVTSVSIDSNNGDILASPVFFSGVTLGASFDDRFLSTRLYLDDQGRYTHRITGTGTNYASYIIITPLTLPGIGEIKNTLGKTQGYSIDARVLTRGVRNQEYDLKTLITDWKR